MAHSKQNVRRSKGCQLNVDGIFFINFLEMGKTITRQHMHPQKKETFSEKRGVFNNAPAYSFTITKEKMLKRLRNCIRILSSHV